LPMPRGLITPMPVMTTLFLYTEYFRNDARIAS
jgi:hypothetical protein